MFKLVIVVFMYGDLSKRILWLQIGCMYVLYASENGV